MEEWRNGGMKELRNGGMKELRNEGMKNRIIAINYKLILL
jgi:hypothetical protein